MVRAKKVVKYPAFRNFFVNAMSMFCLAVMFEALKNSNATTTIAASLSALKATRFVCVKPAIRGFSSSAPKNAMPTIVVSQSRKPAIIRVVKIRRGFFGMFVPRRVVCIVCGWVLFCF